MNFAFGLASVTHSNESSEIAEIFTSVGETAKIKEKKTKKNCKPQTKEILIMSK